VAFVRRHYESLGFEVKNVTRARGEQGGYDLPAVKGSERITAEVKGTLKGHGREGATQNRKTLSVYQDSHREAELQNLLARS
jgi:hypothetical protein